MNEMVKAFYIAIMKTMPSTSNSDTKIDNYRIAQTLRGDYYLVYRKHMMPGETSIISLQEFINNPTLMAE